MSNLLRVKNFGNRTICWRRLDEKDHDVVVHIMNIFCETEPIFEGMKFPKEQTRYDVIHALKLLHARQSICAYDQESNDVLGMTIISEPVIVRECKLLDAGPEPTLKQKQLIRLFKELWRSFPEESKEELCQKSEYIVVDPQYRGMGIGTALAQKALDLAKDQGCKLFLAECSSAFSAKVLENIGAVCLGQIIYQDYIDPLTGERILTNIAPPHKEFKLMCRYL